MITGLFLGVAYGFITMRFALGPFGVVPTFNMPMGATVKSHVVQHEMQCACRLLSRLTIVCA